MKEFLDTNLKIWRNAYTSFNLLKCTVYFLELGLEGSFFYYSGMKPKFIYRENNAINLTYVGVYHEKPTKFSSEDFGDPNVTPGAR